MKLTFVTQWFLRAAVAVLVLPGIARTTFAQPVDFASSDDPRERLQRVWWRYQSSLDLTGGLSLISDHWRAGLNSNLNFVSRPATGRLSGTVRGGIYGRYDPDTDELYDLLRVVEFARLNVRPRSPLYLRAGLIDRVRLGSGHLVNFYNSYVAWDTRTVGAEGMLAGGFADVAAFTDNVLLDGVVGGRAAVRPFYGSRNARLRSVELGLNYVSDLDTRSGDTLGVTGYNVDLKAHAVTSGEIRFVPFVSYAWYPEYGRGIGFGASVESDHFIELARFRLRMALYYNGREFLPGYVGSFYRVNNPKERLLNADRFLTSKADVVYEGVLLDEAVGGNDLETELRILIFERFEFWYYFRRHYGTQNLSEYHLRLFFNQPNRLRLNIGMDRGGLKSFFGLFSDLSDQSALVFGIDYRILGPFWALIHARYTFEEAGKVAEGTEGFLVQRRFEPFTGMRIEF